MHKARFLSKLFLVFLSVIGASHRSVYGSEIKEDKYIYLPITDGQIRSAPMFFLKCDLLNDFTAVSIHPNLSFPSLKKVRLGDGIKVPGKEMGHFRVVSNTTFEVDMDGKIVATNSHALHAIYRSQTPNKLLVTSRPAT